MKLEDLVKTFAEHEKKLSGSNKRLIKQFKKNNPDKKLPDHFKSDFSLPKALSFMCSEILRLKNVRMFQE